MQFSILGVTKEAEPDLTELKTFSGKNAGICYQGDKYYNTSVSDPEKAFSRFSRVANTGHHSISDHAQVTVLLEGISKMMAMVLNSLGYYATSEKSGRYTVMTGNSDKEKELYEKWLEIFKVQIKQNEPNLNETLIIKLAQENARYVLSVFTRSTTMSYTTSLRQWNYIYDWCLKYMKHYEVNGDKVYSINDNNEASYYEAELYKDFSALSDFIAKNLYVDELRDNKNRAFDFLGGFSGSDFTPILSYRLAEYNFEDESINESVENDDKLDFNYSVSYWASFVHIAQAQRHRTLTYWMTFSPYNEARFFVPPIIRNTEFEKVWLEDLNSIKDVVPQATMFEVIETGTLDKFILKCEERLCGRAQLEIMQQTKKTVERFRDHYSILSPIAKEYIGRLLSSGARVRTKCELLDSCKEPCRFGFRNALNRNI